MPGSVLIIDADALFAGHAQAALESRGVAVAIRDDAPIDVIRRLRPSVMVVNVQLPKVSGYSICNRLRSDKELSQIPILLTSAEADEAFRRHSTTPTRADDYVHKPLEIADLVARVGRLLQVAAQRQLPIGALEGGDAARTLQDSAPSGAQRPAPEGPPPITGRVPASMPPPLPNPAAGLMSMPAPAAPPDPRASMGAGPPPIKRALPSMPDDSAWRAVGFDEMIRERVNEAAPVAPPKVSSADDRERYLRAYGKHLETKEKAARAGWDALNEQGRDLDRRFQSARFDIAQRDAKIAELGAELERTQAQLVAVSTELKTFQAEITKIFEEKDAEERETIARLSQLEDQSRALTKDLTEARKQNDADKTRLKIFKQDLDELQAEGAKLSAALQAANDRAIRAEDAHRYSEQQIQVLEARLSDAETSLVERSEALSDAEEAAALEAERIANEHRAELDAKVAELRGQIQDLEGTELQLRGDIDALEIARSELETALAGMTQERDHLLRVKAELAAALDEQEIEAQTRYEQLEGDLKRLQSSGAGQAARVNELEASRAALDKELRETQDELLKEQATWTTREAELNEAVTELEQEILRLEQDHGAATKRVAELEAELEATKAGAAASGEEVEELRANIFDRVAELDAIRSNAHNLQRQVETLRADLSGERAKVASSEAAQRALGAQRTALEAEIAGLSQKLIDAEASRDAAEDSDRSSQAIAEELQKKLDKSEAFVGRAKEKIGELQRAVSEASQASKQALEAERALVAEARAELAQRDEEAAQASRRVLELESELEAKSGQQLEALAAKDQEIADRDSELEELRTSAFEFQAAAESAEERIGALIKDVEARERAAQTLRSELAERDRRLSELGLELVKSRDQLRANAELTRERERRDAMLGRVMAVLEQVQATLASAPRTRARASLPAPAAASAQAVITDAIDVVAALGVTHDAPTRDVSASWPATPKPPIDDEQTSEGSLRERIEALRGPFPSMAPMLPTAPIRPDALSQHDRELFGALLHDIQSETAAPARISSPKPARRVSVEPPPRHEPPKAAKRARIVKQEPKAKAPEPPPPPFGEGLDEAALLIGSNLPDERPSMPRMDPFRLGGAALGGAQPNPADDLEELEEREVTEIIRLDRLK